MGGILILLDKGDGGLSCEKGVLIGGVLKRFVVKIRETQTFGHSRVAG